MKQRLWRLAIWLSFASLYTACFVLFAAEELGQRLDRFLLGGKK